MRAPTSATMGDLTSATRGHFTSAQWTRQIYLYRILMDRDRGGAGRGPAGPVGPVSRPADAVRPSGKRLAVAAAPLGVTCVSRRACDGRGERERESAQERDDLNKATNRHSVGPPDPTGDLAWAALRSLCDHALAK